MTQGRRPGAAVPVDGTGVGRSPLLSAGASRAGPLAGTIRAP